jgi:hypothetical protein
MPELNDISPRRRLVRSRMKFISRPAGPKGLRVSHRPAVLGQTPPTPINYSASLAIHIAIELKHNLEFSISSPVFADCLRLLFGVGIAAHEWRPWQTDPRPIAPSEADTRRVTIPPLSRVMRQNDRPTPTRLSMFISVIAHPRPSSTPVLLIRV